MAANIRASIGDVSLPVNGEEVDLAGVEAVCEGKVTWCVAVGKMMASGCAILCCGKVIVASDQNSRSSRPGCKGRGCSIGICWRSVDR